MSISQTWEYLQHYIFIFFWNKVINVIHASIKKDMIFNIELQVSTKSAKSSNIHKSSTSDSQADKLWGNRPCAGHILDSYTSVSY